MGWGRVQPRLLLVLVVLVVGAGVLPAPVVLVVRVGVGVLQCSRRVIQLERARLRAGFRVGWRSRRSRRGTAANRGLSTRHRA